MTDKFLVFHPVTVPAHIKTTRWLVRNRNDYPLGTICWFNAWRRYVFQPLGNTTFDANCLVEIKEFLEQLMKEHKEEKNVQNKESDGT